MKTPVAEVDGEAILAFRAQNDDAAERIIGEEDGGFQIVVRGYSGLLLVDRRPLWDGTSPIRYRLASPHEHGLWLTLRSAQIGSPDDPDDIMVLNWGYVWEAPESRPTASHGHRIDSVCKTAGSGLGGSKMLIPRPARGRLALCVTIGASGVSRVPLRQRFPS
jgi:hypothetical protein